MASYITKFDDFIKTGFLFHGSQSDISKSDLLRPGDRGYVSASTFPEIAIFRSLVTNKFCKKLDYSLGSRDSFLKNSIVLLEPQANIISQKGYLYVVAKDYFVNHSNHNSELVSYKAVPIAQKFVISLTDLEFRANFVIIINSVEYTCSTLLQAYHFLKSRFP